MIASLLHSYGYLAVALFVGFESIGVPIPGETMLISAALYAGSSGHLNIVTIAAVAAGAAIVGDNIGYYVGRRFGRSFVVRHGHRVGLTPTRLTVARYLFDRHGGKVVFFGRFVSVIRTYAAAAAGIMGLPRRRFVLANTTGGLLWAGLFSFGAYELGSAASRVGTVASFVGAGLAAVVFVGFALVTRSSVRWLERRALAAYPDDSVAGRGVELAFK